MGDDMSAYKDVFLSESADYIQAITEGLLALESDPNDLEPVETVFRGAHSLKGMAAAMGYVRTQELTHKMESLMDTVRSRRQVADPTLITRTAGIYGSQCIVVAIDAKRRHGDELAARGPGWDVYTHGGRIAG